jgi:hypothetical protein
MSYTKVDRGWAEWISWQLEDAGYTVLLQAWDMVPGSNWLRMMNQATKLAQHTIAVLSIAYLTDSALGEAEWLAAYRHDPSGLAGRLIPIRIEECIPDGLLAGIVYTDVFGLGDKDAAKEELLRAVRAAVARRGKPVVEPDFPDISSPVRRAVSAPPAWSHSDVVLRSFYGLLHAKAALDGLAEYLGFGLAGIGFGGTISSIVGTSDTVRGIGVGLAVAGFTAGALFRGYRRLTPPDHDRVVREYAIPPD